MGVGVNPAGSGLRYALPWVKYRGFHRNGWAALAGGAMPCLAAMALPYPLLRELVLGGEPGPRVVLVCFCLFWSALFASFALLFGGFALVVMAKGGRCLLWLSHRGIQAVQFRGTALRTSWFALADLKRLAVFEVAGKPVLVAVGTSEVKRLAEDYPSEFLDAVAAHMKGWIDTQK